MNDRDLINAASGYVAGKAVSNSVISGLRKYNEEAARKLAHWTPEETLSAEIAKFLLLGDKQGAFEYLNSHFNDVLSIDAPLSQEIPPPHGYTFIYPERKNTAVCFLMLIAFTIFV